jgi:hypothetical protein
MKRRQAKTNFVRDLVLLLLPLVLLIPTLLPLLMMDLLVLLVVLPLPVPLGREEMGVALPHVTSELEGVVFASLGELLEVAVIDGGGPVSEEAPGMSAVVGRKVGERHVGDLGDEGLHGLERGGLRGGRRVRGN